MRRAVSPSALSLASTATVALFAAACVSTGASPGPAPGDRPDSSIDAETDGNPAPSDAGSTDSPDAATPTDGGAPISFPPGPCSTATPPPAGTPACATLGSSCLAAGLYGLGSGSLLVCDAGTWRYALRSDVPDGTYGGFTTRPSWYPPLRSFYNMPAAAAPCKLTLAHAPIDPSQITTIVPGGMMIGFHVAPIDHFYMSVTGTAASPTPIYADADGTVILVDSLGGAGNAPNTLQVAIAHACETVSVYGVINQLAGVLAPYQSIVAAGGRVNPQLSVHAGDIIGEQWLDPMELSIQDGSVWLSGIAHPFPYASELGPTPYVGDPLAYLPQPAASQYQALMQCTVSPRSGKIDWDTAGTAAGTWFLSGTLGSSGNLTSAYVGATTPVTGGQAPGKNGYQWSLLALAPHWVQRSVWVASIGSWADPAGDFVQYMILPGPVAPDQLSVGQTAAYELATWDELAPDGGAVDYAIPPAGYQVVPRTTIGVFAVRVNSDNTLTVEKRPDLTNASSFTGFTSLAQTYWR